MIGDILGNRQDIIIATKVGNGQGVVRLIHADGQWKAYTLYTALMELTGFEEPRGPRRPTGHEHRGDKGTKNWQEARVSDANFEASEPAVLIIGTAPSPPPPRPRCLADRTDPFP